MSSRVSAPEAVLFDAYGTLFDVYSVGLLAEQLFPGRGDALAALWRDKQIEYTRLASMSGRYRPFWELTRAGLRYACGKLGVELTPAHEERLMNQYRHLSAFPENREVLQALKDRRIVTGILSNGDPGMLGIAVRSAGLEELLDHVLSVDTVRKYKTHPDAYQLGPKATAGRDLVRLPHALGQPLPAAFRGAWHPAHAHRQHAARRSLFFLTLPGGKNT
jgi:2-haloacid dehalogenase